MATGGFKNGNIRELGSLENGLLKTTSGVLDVATANEDYLEPTPNLVDLSELELTQGDILYYNDGALSVIPFGSNNQFLGINGTEIGWFTLGGGGGGAPTNAKYLVTESNPALTDEVVFPVNVAAFILGVGQGALQNNSAGNGNTAMGLNALHLNTEGSINTAYGLAALYSNTVGNTNCAFGSQPLYYNVGGLQNNAFGYRSLYRNTSGNSNCSFGTEALYANTTYAGSAAFGYQALYSVTANRNSAFGYRSLYGSGNPDAPSTGNGNAAFGSESLRSLTSGIANCAFGAESLLSTTTGNTNCAFGSSALQANIGGTGNSAFGYYALHDNVSGIYNQAFGQWSLYKNTTGSGNIAIGFNALYNNLTEDYSIAIGHNALYSSTSTPDVIALGRQALENATTPLDCIAIGAEALIGNIDGVSNISLGNYSLPLSASNDNVIAIGHNIAPTATLLRDSIAIGNNTFANFTTTDSGNNIAIGHDAGSSIPQLSGSACIFIGNAAKAGADALTNAGAIGTNATVSVSNALVLGNSMNIGIGTNSPLYALHIGDDYSMNPLFYMKNNPGGFFAPTPTDGVIYYSRSGAPAVTSSDSNRNGAIVTARTDVTCGTVTLQLPGGGGASTSYAPVSTTAVTAASRIFVSYKNLSSPAPEDSGILYVPSRVVGSGFMIISTSETDQSTVDWILVNPQA